MRSRALALCSSALLLVSACVGAQAQDPGTASAGRIVFYSERSGNAEIYVMNPDGTALTRLTTNATNEFCPDWSPSGTRIAFESDRDDPRPVACFPNCVFKIYVMDADGSNERRLMDLPGSEGHPDWSPDGRSLVFQADRDGDGKNEIYVVPSEGGEPRLVIGGAFDSSAPDFSPDGVRIAFTADRDGGLDLFLVGVDGTDLRKLVDTGVNDYSPDWSPDGQEILFFAANWPSVRQDLYVIRADGTGLRQITATPRTVDEGGQWSSDGFRIVFQTDRDRNFEIYSMKPDGSDVVRLTNDRGGDYWPDLWMPPSPEARQQDDHPIAFVSTRGGAAQIYTMNADGSDPRRLTNERSDSYFPAWSPDGTQIAYYVHLTWQSWALVVIQADGTGRRQVTEGSGCAVCAFGPYWSPDGKRIGFTIEPDPRPTCEIKSTEIGVVNADGTDCRRLTENTWTDLFCGWSPDGRSILYASNREGRDQVYRADADHSNERRLTETGTTNHMPAWSPDGTKIAFVSNRDGNDEIYVMNADGSNVARVTVNPAHDWMPAWSADGTELLFSSDRDGRELDVYATTLDGTAVRRLTTAAGYDYEAVWRW